MINDSAMRRFAMVLAGIGLAGGLTLLAQEKKGPDKLVFKSMKGNVTFDHASHVTRAGGECSTCHPKLFKESSTAPLNFRAGIHKTAETAKTSCGSCHHPGGTAFESSGNCMKCHSKA